MVLEMGDTAALDVLAGCRFTVSELRPADGEFDRPFSLGTAVAPATNVKEIVLRNEYLVQKHNSSVQRPSLLSGNKFQNKISIYQKPG